MKELSADVEVGKFGGRVSAPPTRSSQSSALKTLKKQGSIDTIKIAPLNYDNAILVNKI